MLNERGIKAVTPSALNTPAGPNFSPTVTPCNSPGKCSGFFFFQKHNFSLTSLIRAEGSPTRSRSPEPQLFPGFISSGADMLRRKLVGDTSPSSSAADPLRPSRISARNKILLSRQEKRALRSLRLMEKVESLGLENIISGNHHHQQTVGISPLALQSSSAITGVRSRTASPMAQLTSLKNISQHGGDHHLVDRGTIKSVLNKSFSSTDSLPSFDGSISGDDMNSECSTTSSIGQGAAKKPPRPTSLEGGAQASATTSSPAKPNSSDIRLKQMQRQKSRRNLINGQRPDLGKVRPDLGKVAGSTATDSASQQHQQKQEQQPVVQQSMTQSFVGSISSLFFGRKGGLL